MYDFFHTGDASAEEVDEVYDNALHALEDLELKNMLSSEEGQLGAVLQITSGAGGTESCDWAEMLMRMYLMCGGESGCKSTGQDDQSGDRAGWKWISCGERKMVIRLQNRIINRVKLQD